MDDRRKDQAERIVKRYAHLIEMQTGKAPTEPTAT